MKLRNKMATCMAVVFAFFAIALGVAISGMQKAATQFDKFIEYDQAFLAASTNLYAQGLQMGQALRNVILSPANQVGYKNLDSARQSFAKEMTTALTLAQRDAAALSILQKVKALQER